MDTGPCRGIGRAMAKLFAANGAKVTALSVSTANAETVVLDIKANGTDRCPLFNATWTAGSSGRDFRSFIKEKHLWSFATCATS